MAQTEADSVQQSLDGKVAQNEARLDSTRTKLDKLSTSVNGPRDSVQSLTTEALENVQALSQKVTNLSDTLSPDINLSSSKLDSINTRLSFKIDSLKQIGQPTQKYTRMLDSLQQRGPFKQLNNVQQKVAGVQQKIMAPADKVGGAINEKLTLMNKEGGSEANIPGQVGVPGINTPGVNTPGMPGVGIPNMPGGDMENPLGGSLPSGTIEGIDGVTDPLKDIGSVPQKEIGELGNIDELNKAKEGLGKVGQVGDQVKGYGEEVKSVKEGGIGNMEQAPKALEGKVEELEQVQGIQKEMGGADEMKGIMENGNDPEAMKKLATEEVKEKAIDHFAGKSEQLRGAMQRVSSLKQKYSSVKSIKDIKKNPPNPMNGKPLVERLVPGLVLQIQASDHWLIDFNPVLGYRVGGKVNAGAGWNYRWSVGSRFKTFHEERIYGPRVYGEWKFGKGFALRADIEKMNTFVPPLGFVGTATEGGRQWVWSAFVGLKKEYKFMKNVNGNFQFFYNLYDDHDNSPYADRLVVRTGFEFPQRKKPKKRKAKKEKKLKS